MNKFSLKKVKPLDKEFVKEQEQAKKQKIVRSKLSNVLAISGDEKQKVGKIGQIVSEKKDLSIADLAKILKNEKKVKHKTILNKIRNGGWKYLRKHDVFIGFEMFFTKNNIDIYILHLLPEVGFPEKYSLYICKGKEIIEYKY